MSNVTKLLVYIDVSVARIKSSAVFEIHELVGAFCYHSAQNLLSFRLLSKNLKIKIYRTITLPVVCMGVKLGR